VAGGYSFGCLTPELADEANARSRHAFQLGSPSPATVLAKTSSAAARTVTRRCGREARNRPRPGDVAYVTVGYSLALVIASVDGKLLADDLQ
jgi:hypothetical protein